MYDFYVSKYVILNLLMMSIVIVNIILFIVMKISLRKYIGRANKSIINVKILEKRHIPYYNFNTFVMINIPIFPITISTTEEYRIYFYENGKEHFINSKEIYSTNKKGDIITLEKKTSYFLGRPYNVVFKVK